MNIYEALIKHHNAVKENYEAVMTVLVGSQNYGLETPNSDFDTFTFVLPTQLAVATLRDPVSTTMEDGIGHIDIKDIRLALNLLKKTSPNSVECFSFKNAYIESKYAGIINELRNPYVLRCDTQHMMRAIGGMAHQLTKRNMSPGKRLSHILRMHCMVYNYFDIESDILSLTEEERKLALQAKMDPENPRWEKLIQEYAQIVDEEVRSVDIGYFDAFSQVAKARICVAQAELMDKVYEMA